MNSATIFHHPKFSTSRSTLALNRNNGDEPGVIDSPLRQPPDRKTLQAPVKASTTPPARRAD